MRIFLITDDTSMGITVPHLFEGIADVVVFPKSKMSYALSLDPPGNYLILGIPFPDESDWNSFGEIQHPYCHSCYLMLGRHVTREDFTRVHQCGLAGILLDPLLALRNMSYKVNQLFSLLEPALFPPPMSPERDPHMIYLGKDTFFHSDELWVGTPQHKNPLSEREVDLLNLFLRNEGKVVTKSMIAKEIWNEQVDLGGISKLVKRLREKLGAQDLIVGRKQGGYLYKRETESHFRQFV